MKKTVTLRCRRTPDTTEILYSIQDALPELDEHADRELIEFLVSLVDFLNYRTDHTPTAFGDSGEAFRRGYVEGFIRAKRWRYKIECECMTIKCRGIWIFVELPPGSPPPLSVGNY